MPDDGSTGSTPKFSFEVKWDATVMQFQEISGLDVETQPIEYRSGENPTFTPIKMPGIKKYGNVTLKRGIAPNTPSIQAWFNQIQMNTVRRTTITITLHDESGAPTMTWTLSNAWPTKINVTDLKSDNNKIAIDSIEIAHEGLTIANG